MVDRRLKNKRSSRKRERERERELLSCRSIFSENFVDARLAVARRGGGRRGGRGRERGSGLLVCREREENGQ